MIPWFWKEQVEQVHTTRPSAKEGEGTGTGTGTDGQTAGIKKKERRSTRRKSVKGQEGREKVTDTICHSTINAVCKISGDTAACTQDVGPSSVHDETTITGISTLYQPVTVTAGAEKLTAGAASPASTASGGSAVRPTQTVGSAGMPSISAATTTSRPASSTSNPAAAQKTQNALLAGVAAVVGGIMIL
jgi:hypothetical protein